MDVLATQMLIRKHGNAPSILNTSVKNRKDTEVSRTMWQVRWPKEYPEAVAISRNGESVGHKV